MIFKRLNRTDAERVFVVFKANESNIAQDDVVALEDTSPDGILIQQPTTATLSGVVGIADAAIANGAYGLVQVYGYRSSSRVLANSSQAAFRCLKPANAVDYLQSNVYTSDAAIFQPSFVHLESLVDNTSSTLSAKIFIRCM